MSLEPTMVSKIKTKKLNLINPFNQSIINSKLKFAITFTAGKIDNMTLIRLNLKFPVAASKGNVSSGKSLKRLLRLSLPYEFL